jgi:uncharacterized protein with von Willebrand factor type A (vWA) domain
VSFLDAIGGIQLDAASLRKIVRTDLVDDYPDAVDTDEFDDALFLDTAAQVSHSAFYSSKIRNRVQKLQLGNGSAEYALFKDLFNVFYQKEYRMKQDRTSNVTQLLHRDVLRQVESTNTFSFLRETLTNSKAKSFAIAGSMAETIIKNLDEMLNGDYEDSLKAAQQLYDRMLDKENNDGGDGSPGESGAGEPGESGGEKNQGDGRGGVDNFDALPQPVKDALEEVREKAMKTAAGVADGKIKRDVEGAEKILTTFGYGNKSEKAFIDRKIAEQVNLYEDLANNKKIAKIVNILGQIQHRNQERWDKIKTSKHVKLVEIAMGDDITNLLAEEKFNLTDEMLEMELFSRLQENAALIYRSRPKADWKGPIVFCIDESGSMDGAKNIKAKAIALAMMDIALKQNRKFATVHFDTTVSDSYVLGRVDRGKSLDMLLEIAGHFSGGGTAYAPPMACALKLIEKEKFLHNADIVFITDGQASALPTDIYEKIMAHKKTRQLQIITIFIADNSYDRISRSDKRDLAKISDKYLTISDLLEAEEDIFNLAVS